MQRGPTKSRRRGNCHLTPRHFPLLLPTSTALCPCSAPPTDTFYWSLVAALEWTYFDNIAHCSEPISGCRNGTIVPAVPPPVGAAGIVTYSFEHLNTTAATAPMKDSMSKAGICTRMTWRVLTSLQASPWLWTWSCDPTISFASMLAWTACKRPLTSTVGTKAGGAL